MGLWGKLSWLCLVLVVVSISCQMNVPARSWRPRGPLRSSYSAQSGFGAAQRYDRWYPQVVDQSRQQPQYQPISVQCQEASMVVTVQRDLYGIGKMVKASDLTLGPQSCQPSAQSTNLIVVFQAGLEECGNSLQMTPEFMVYSTNLNYNPTPAGNSPIIRTNAASVLIQCYYPRHGNVSSNAIKPTWMPYSSTISAEERLVFSLNLMNDDWSAPRTSTVFRLGDVFHIEASVDSGNHVPMTVFIDSCVATLNPTVNSDPSYEIISLNGCLMDGKEADSTSAFMSPRPQPDKLQFVVDAFRFTGRDVSTIYITCSLRAAAATQVPDPLHKACSFSKTSNTWSPLEGTSDICRCCDTGNCVAFPPQSRRVGHSSQSRGRGKRQAGPDSNVEEEQSLAILGPLLVIGPNHKNVLAVTEDPNSLELGIWVAIGSLSLVVLAVCAAVIGKHVVKKHNLQAELK